MRRVSGFFHLSVVAGGALIIWAVQNSVPGLLRFVNGYSNQVSEWLVIHPLIPALPAIPLALILAATLSWVQEHKRTRGLRWSLWFAVLGGLAAFVTRISSTPASLHEISALMASLRAGGLAAAAVGMYYAKKALLAIDAAK